MKAPGKDEVRSASKFSKVEALTQKSKAMSVGMEGWVANNKNQSAMLEAHNDAISTISKNLRILDQQVKAMARVMANNTDQKTPKAADVGGMKEEIMKAIDESRDDIMNRVSKELTTSIATKTELNKKIHAAVDKMTELIMQKDDQQSHDRLTLMNTQDKIQSRINGIEASIQQESNRQKEFCVGQTESIKKVLQTLQANLDQDRVQRERAHMATQIEMQKVVETQRTNLVTVSKELKTYVDKAEASLLDKTKSISAELVKESHQRMDMAKSFKNYNLDTMNAFRIDIDKTLHTLDVETERKVSSVARLFPELRMALEHERTTRETTCSELGRAIEQERKDRDADEDKLMSMISATMAAIDKLHKA